MDFHKVETASNFVFSPPEARALRVTDYGSDVFRVQGSGPRWPRGTDSFATLTPQEFAGVPSGFSVALGPGGEVALRRGETELLASAVGRGFGVCGSKWVVAFPYDPAHRFYGMGEKNLGFELSGKRTKFWNTDVFGDFYWDQIEKSSTDPFYGSYPVLIIKTSNGWVGLLVDNPHAVFMNTGAAEQIFQPGAGPFVPELFFGSRDGAPDFWLVAAPDAPTLVRRLQTLQGRTPLPPLWALGHQQCRWGYRSYDDLRNLADQYQTHGIPNDGLWLDIDYMEGFRVFTVDSQHFPDLEKQLAELAGRGHRVIPILDPGFRKDPAYAVYAEASAKGLLCQTPEGQEFVGFVWPGYTVFPDFSLPEARDDWARRVKALSDRGFGGYWIDMNDPSTGSVPLEDMRFGRGTLPHEAWHNQYALGMAVATRQGLLDSRPNERPFVISRSGFLSQSRHSAVWTGDNMSNEHHMKGTLALTLNLSVSGMPFNGPDVPGFALSASNELMRAWYKLGFLFPFLRNHKIMGQTDQEPWTRDELTTTVVGDYIRLRYKLLPYLYNNFVAQAETGDPMLRPVWYHDPSPAFEKTDDMFFVGPSILQAPFVDLAATTRAVTLPRHASGSRWFDVASGLFVGAGETLTARNDAATTPIYLSTPSLIALQSGVRRTNRNNLNQLELLVVVGDGEGEVTYQTDDGFSLDHETGARTRVEFSMLSKDGSVDVWARTCESGSGAVAFRVLLLTSLALTDLNLNGRRIPLVAELLPFAGRNLPVLGTAEVTV